MIDVQLSAAGWHVADSGSPVGRQPTALCEASGQTEIQSGRAYYILYLDGKSCGIIEAKRSNHSIECVQGQSATKDLTDFIAVYQPGNIAKRKETDRFKKFTYEEIVGSDTAPRDSADDPAKPDRRARPAQQGRDKANLDIFWLKDESLEDTENLPPPAELAAETVASLESALEEFRSVEDALADVE